MNMELNILTTSTKGYCKYHGLTEFYKNRKCKECVKYSRLFKRMQTLENQKKNTNYLDRKQ
jgi:hypothetical protein